MPATTAQLAAPAPGGSPGFGSPETFGYDDIGAGARTADGTTLLLLPGWCGDRSVFDALLTPLATRHRVVCTDLPEHGTRPRTGTDFGAADVVTDAVALLEHCGVDRVVPIALSHAGWVAIELRRRLGAARVPGIVLLDWMVLGPPPGFLDALAGLQHPSGWREVRAGLFTMWTSGLDIAALHDYVSGMGSYGAAYWQRAGREIAGDFAAAGSPLAALETLAQQGDGCPTLHLYAQPGDDAVLDAQRDYANRQPWFAVQRLEARSHFPMFEVPADMAAAIDRFIGGLT